MLARIRKSAEEKDQGFTLIELLVVIIIIGILAAIAIPVFLNQRKKAVEAGMKSDLRSLANEVETFYTDSQVYPADAAVTQATTAAADPVVIAGGNSVRVSHPDTVISYTYVAASDSYQLEATNAKVDNDWCYDSNTGGLKVGLC